MLQLENKTPFEIASFVFPDRNCIDTVYVVIKGTFDFKNKLQIAEKQQLVVEADQYWGEAGRSSIKYATEAHLEKPGTDFVVVGDAYAPNRRPVSELDIGLSVAGRTAVYKVFGDRQWKGTGLLAWPGKPKPFVRMPLVYERAYGGMHTVVTNEGEKVYAEPRNPVGKGFRGKKDFADIKKEPVPNIEDPKDLISSPRDHPKPVGLGFIAPCWEPRLLYTGTYDLTWEKKRAPYLPLDFDQRFFHAAHPDWVFPEYLRGGEPIQTLNLSPKGKLGLRIPKCNLSVEVNIDGKIEKPVANLETVLLEPSEDMLCLTWRAWLPAQRDALRNAGLSVALENMQLS